jgi:hypothetical protein
VDGKRIVNYPRLQERHTAAVFHGEIGVVWKTRRRKKERRKERNK